LSDELAAILLEMVNQELDGKTENNIDKRFRYDKKFRYDKRFRYDKKEDDSDADDEEWQAKRYRFRPKAHILKFGKRYRYDKRFESEHDAHGQMVDLKEIFKRYRLG